LEAGWSSAISLSYFYNETGRNELEGGMKYED